MKRKEVHKKDKTIALILPYVGGGGAERVAADLSLYFSSKGYNIVIFVQYRASGKMVYPHAGNEEIIPMTALYQKKYGKNGILALYNEVRVLKRLKKEHGVDVSISFMPESNMLNLLSRYRDKVIVTLHAVVSEDKVLNICKRKWVFQYLYQLADSIVFVSKYCQRDWIKNYGDILHRTQVIYNPVRKMENIDCKYLGYENNLILFLARFEGIKRPWHIIRMFSRVLKKIPDARLLMLGDGTLLDSMKELARSMGIEKHITFAGRVGNVEDYLRIAKVSVLASSSEAFPCSVIEAMKCGVPVVANDCPGGIREALRIRKQSSKCAIKRADCGLITPFLDGKKYSASDELSIEERYMADAVVRLLMEQSLYEECSRACKLRAKKFDLERIGLIWEDLIQ